MVWDILKYTTDAQHIRYKHLTGCYELARKLLCELDIREDIKEKIYNTVLLHDIGYSDELSLTKEHTYNAYMYLSEKYPDITFYNCILLHSNYITHCPKELKNTVYKIFRRLTELEKAVLAILDYCDAHIDGLGAYVDINGRLYEKLKRNIEDSVRFDIILEKTTYLRITDKLLPYYLIKLKNNHEIKEMDDMDKYDYNYSCK